MNDIQCKSKTLQSAKCKHCYGPDYCDKLIYLTFKSQTTADVSQDPEHKYLESGEKQHVSTLWVCPEI